MKMRQKIRRWAIPLLGGAVSILAISEPSLARVYGASGSTPCYYYTYSKKCHAGTFSSSTQWCCLICPPTWCYHKTSTAYATTCGFALYGGSSLSMGPSFTGLCSYTYTVKDCNGTTSTPRTSNVSLNPCYGSC